MINSFIDFVLFLAAVLSVDISIYWAVDYFHKEHYQYKYGYYKAIDEYNDKRADKAQKELEIANNREKLVQESKNIHDEFNRTRRK